MELLCDYFLNGTSAYKNVISVPLNGIQFAVNVQSDRKRQGRRNTKHSAERLCNQYETLLSKVLCCMQQPMQMNRKLCSTAKHLVLANQLFTQQSALRSTIHCWTRRTKHWYQAACQHNDFVSMQHNICCLCTSHKYSIICLGKTHTVSQN